MKGPKSFQTCIAFFNSVYTVEEKLTHFLGVYSHLVTPAFTPGEYRRLRPVITEFTQRTLAGAS